MKFFNSQVLCPKHKFLLLILVIMLSMLQFTKAQVNMGSGASAEAFSVLQLDSNGTKGFRLPQLTTQQRNAMTTSSFKGKVEAQGICIFNVTTKCYEYWNGDKWVSLCGYSAP